MIRPNLTLLSIIPALAASVALAQGPQGEPEGWDGLERALLVSGHTTFSRTSTRPEGSTTESSNTLNQGSSALEYLFHAGGTIWIGPRFAYELVSGSTRSGSYYSRLSATVLSPGMSLRTVLPSGKDQYFALGVSAGYRLVGGDTEELNSGTTTTSDVSGSGLGYGASVSFGQRLGRERAYLIEAGFGVSGSSADLTATESGTASKSSVSETGFVFNFSIGMAL